MVLFIYVAFALEEKLSHVFMLLIFDYKYVYSYMQFIKYNLFW